MVTESISRKEIFKLSRKIIFQDKEILVFSFLYLIICVIICGVIVWEVFTFVLAITNRDGLYPLYMLSGICLGVYLVAMFHSTFLYSFYYALIVRCTGDRLAGKNPSFSSTVLAIKSQWKKVFTIYLRSLQPLPLKYFMYRRYAKEFLMQEMLLSNTPYKEALEKTVTYASQDWYRDMIFSFRISLLFSCLFLLGFILPILSVVVILYPMASPIVSIYLARILLDATPVYYIGYFVFINAASCVYQTVLYEKYVKKGVFEKTSYQLLIKTGNKEKAIPL